MLEIMRDLSRGQWIDVAQTGAIGCEVIVLAIIAIVLVRTMRLFSRDTRATAEGLRRLLEGQADQMAELDRLRKRITDLETAAGTRLERNNRRGQ